MVYKCLNVASSTFAPLTHSSWDLRSHSSICLPQPFTHTDSYILVSLILSHYGTSSLESVHHSDSLSSFTSYVKHFVWIAFFLGVLCTSYMLLYVLCVCVQHITRTRTPIQIHALSHTHTTYMYTYPTHNHTCIYLHSTHSDTKQDSHKPTHTPTPTPTLTPTHINTHMHIPPHTHSCTHTH